ncbi:MAG: contractile injection system protein, VgrG/Pvc8 family [Paracoccus sp. (in: a-proteobacteria)]|uniref:phage late control D family protein n=1 Tax=Paracoccus sp. TaxID=267 RepID=UPI0026DF5A71|nr:contractile injection system protein, VgrG/Pvc8 family [Paracoccus sp. (in: a-proteobacteria)]MDO5631151.1 contractile injection system protein, VgrG/Pvc8 family [Paracoccus sp. (in: a-proteobacteria)]
MINLAPLTPQITITADGQPFAMDRVLSVEITDEAGFESDELVITLDDAAPQIARPREGAKLTVAIGYRETGLVQFGTYVFEELAREGWPRICTLTAKAADHAKTLKEPKTRIWEKTTLAEIVETIAAEHNLQAQIAPALGALAVPFLAQTEESDQNLLTRLGRRTGAVITPKDQRLLVTARHSGKTASGQPMPALPVTPDMLITDRGYSIRLKPRARHSEIRARWRDRPAGRTKIVVLKTGLEGPSMTLREVFQSEPEAQKAADAAKRDMVAGEGEMELTLIGQPLARAEAPVQVSGVSLDVDGNWIATSVTHEWAFKGGGARTTIRAEFGADSDEE